MAARQSQQPPETATTTTNAEVTRRQFFGQSGLALGSMAIAALSTASRNC